jgi:hypothetical protein
MCTDGTLFECDVCLTMVPKLRRVWVAGTETMACPKCTGDDEVPDWDGNGN